MATVKEVLAIARAELGYTEQPGNITKYWDELTAVDWFDGMNKQGGPWCMGLQCWIALKATGSKAAGRKFLCQTGPLGACCDDQVIYFKEANRFFREPKVGDLIFFDYDPNKNNGEDHVGLVDEIVSYGLYSIEGNSHDSVRRNFYYFTDTDIAGYGRPMYDDAVVDSPIEEEKPVVEPSKGVSEYIVKEGDTLSQIAEDLGVDYMALAINNGIANPDLIYVGQRLVIGGKKTTAPTTVSEEFQRGDRVKIEQNALVYGKPYMFSSWVYNVELYICQIDYNSVLVATTPNPSVYIGWVEKSKVRKV